MTEDYRRGFWAGVAVGAFLTIASLFFIQVVHGQTLDTGSSQGFLDNSGWRSEYSLPQCRPNGCGPGGCPVPGQQPQMWGPPPSLRFQQPQQNQQLRPLNERLQLDSMVHVPASGGGLGVHIGNGIVVSCWHGDTKDIAWKGVRYLAQVLGGSPTKIGDVVVLKVNAPFTSYVKLVQSLPVEGTQVQWQGGQGSVIRYDNDTMFIRGYCRLGDSGSPIWTANGLVGVLSSFDTETHTEVIGAHSVFIQTLLNQLGNPNLYQQQTVTNDEKPVTVVDNSSSAPAGVPDPKPSVQEGSVNPQGDGPAGVNAEPLLLRMAETLEAIHAKIAASKTGDATTIKQEVSQAVTVQMENTGRQLIDKELVPLKSRVDQLELQQQALQLALASIATGPGGKGEKGDTGPPGQDAVVDMDALAAQVILKLPPREVHFLDADGNVAASQTVGPNDPIEIPPVTMTDAQIAALAKRLPPIYLRAKDPNTGLLSDEIRVKLGEGGIIVITKDTSPVSGGN